MAQPLIELLLRQLHLAFDRRSWHGSNLIASLRGLEPELLAWRPQPGRHNIAELAVHAAYWKYRVYRLLTDAPPRSFELPGSNFFARNAVPTPAEWRVDLQLLRAWHQRLAEAVAGFPPDRLDQRSGAGEFSFAELISGAAAHDLYHAGQVQLIRRLHAHR